MDWCYYVNKKIYVILKNKRQYSGIVLEVFKEENPTVIFIRIKDMKERPVIFPISQIEVIEEEEDKEEEDTKTPFTSYQP